MVLRNCSVFAVEGLRGTEHCHQFAVCSQLGTEYFSASSAEECRFGFVVFVIVVVVVIVVVFVVVVVVVVVALFFF